MPNQTAVAKNLPPRNPPAAQPAVDTRPVFFLHIPKTAGTSFLLTLENAFGSNRMLRINDSAADLGAEVADILANRLADVSCLAGHVPIHLFAGALHRLRPFTLLRNPIARVFSLYRFIRRAPPLVLAEMRLLPGFSFQDFITSDAPALYSQTNDGMCRLLCGDPALTDHEAPAFLDPTLQGAMPGQAMAALERMDFGLVEHMGATLDMMRGLWAVPHRLEENVKNTTGQDDSEQDIDAIHQVIARNTNDIALYERASALFRARLRLGTNLGDKAGHSLFMPRLNEAAIIADIPGRQGFHETEDLGFAWLKSDRPASIHFRAPVTAAAIRFRLRIFCVIPNYSVDRLVLRLNGKPLAHNARNSGDTWCEIETERTTLQPGANELSLDPSHFISLRLLDPATKDERYLAIALQSLMLLS